LRHETNSKHGEQVTAIRFAITPCSFGYLLLAATERGICSVRLGDSEETLEASLRQEFSAAELQRDEAGLEGWVQILREHLAGRRGISTYRWTFEPRIFNGASGRPFARFLMARPGPTLKLPRQLVNREPHGQ
jgi:hypothetical protein